MADVEFQTTEPYQQYDMPLEGDITVPGAPPGEDDDEEPSTLEEPIRDTVATKNRLIRLKMMRDLRAVGVKFLHVLYPKQSRTLLKEWDLWGPLFLCVFISMMLQGAEADNSSDGGPQFAEVFIIYWVGAIVVTLNIKLLGGSISFFQSVCVLGYCVSPLAIALIGCRIILFADQNIGLFTIRFILVLAGFFWSTFASTAFLADSHLPNRKVLAMYPIFLFYFVISWLIISHTHST